MPVDPAPAAAPASLRRRFASLLYEALLLVALVFVAGFALAPIVSPQGAASHRIAIPTTAGRVVSFAALFALGAAYFVFSWSAGRRTLPMKTWKLALVTLDGRPLDRRRAFGRYVAAWIGPALALAAYVPLHPLGWGALAWPLLALGWIAAFVDRDRQFLHDRIAGTRLVFVR
ncbi:MAG TPA: RDD family protein [Casimicrobiaceae bacterium]|nr:RDD family protein [Casimicrobiaceae bacterium]